MRAVTFGKEGFGEVLRGFCKEKFEVFAVNRQSFSSFKRFVEEELSFEFPKVQENL
jgi:hypothetical protein